MADTFASYQAKLAKLERSLEGPGKNDLLNAAGMGAKKDAVEAVESDLGDRSMSHWRRSKPIEVGAQYKIVTDDTLDVTPRPVDRGPWRVLEDGRKGGGAFDLVQVGKVRKDGTRRGKSRGRNQGATEGKRTWSDATELMADRTPKRIQEEHVKTLRMFG